MKEKKAVYHMNDNPRQILNSVGGVFHLMNTQTNFFA